MSDVDDGLVKVRVAGGSGSRVFRATRITPCSDCYRLTILFDGLIPGTIPQKKVRVIFGSPIDVMVLSGEKKSSKSWLLVFALTLNFVEGNHDPERGTTPSSQSPGGRLERFEWDRSGTLLIHFPIGKTNVQTTSKFRKGNSNLHQFSFVVLFLNELFLIPESFCNSSS